MFETRIRSLVARMCDAGLDTAVITDDDSVYYLTGYHD